MITNYLIQHEARHNELLHEAAHERLVNEARQGQPTLWQRLIARLPRLESRPAAPIRLPVNCAEPACG